MLSDLELVNVHQRTFWEGPVQFQERPLFNVAQTDDERIPLFAILPKCKASIGMPCDLISNAGYSQPSKSLFQICSNSIRRRVAR